jgi:hypothetical protein
MPAEKKLLVPFAAPGSLSANWVLTFRMPCAATLIEASFGGSNANDATLKIGNAGDDDAYLLESAYGDSGTPVAKVAADFVGAVCPFIAGDTVIKLTTDYNGNAGTAVADPAIVLTFLVGS